MRSASNVNLLHPLNQSALYAKNRIPLFREPRSSAAPERIREGAAPPRFRECRHRLQADDGRSAARKTAARAPRRRPSDRSPHNRAAECARRKSQPRTWRKARASHRDRSRRGAPSRVAAQAWRITSISACAVGSRSRSVRLPAAAMISPLRISAAPTGTSPAAAAARACSKAALKGSLPLICISSAIALQSALAACYQNP